MSGKSFEPTASQIQAISAKNRSIIVSAAAGSGKTRVLVERYIGLLSGGEAPEKILVITFTRKAASQLKERTMREIMRSSEPGLKNLAPRLASAPISTIHSFCSQLIREFASKLDIDPYFATLEEDVAAEIKERAFRKISAKYARNAADRNSYEKLLRLFGSGRDDAGMKTMIFELFEFLRRLPDPEALKESWLEMYSEASEAKEFEDTKWGKLYYEAMANRVRELSGEFDVLASEFNSLPIPSTWQNQLSNELDNVTRILSFCPDIEKMAEVAEGDWVLKQMPRKKDGDNLRSILWKDKWKKFRDSVAKDFAKEWLTPPRELIADLKRLWDSGSLRFLERAVDDFQNAYFAFKKNGNALDFADLEREAYRLVSAVSDGDEAVKTALQTRFTHILMDEYQDTNPLQDAIVDKLAGSEHANVFRVGDIKQSIYRFRHAEPELFQARYAESVDGDEFGIEKRRIDLADNFRSALPIVEFVNAVMRRTMTDDFGGAEYTRGHELKHMFDSVADDPEYTGKFPAVSVKLVSDTGESYESDENDENEIETGAESGDSTDSESPEELDRVRREAALIAKEILSLINANPKIQVYEESEKGLVKTDLRLGHITILLSAVVNSTNAYAEVFGSLGIPLWGTGRDVLTELPVIRDAISLLEIIDNPIQDIPLAACILGTPCGASPDAVYLIRRESGDFDSLFQAISTFVESENGELEKALVAEIEDDAKCRIESSFTKIRHFWKKLDAVRSFSAAHPVYKTTEFALKTFGILDQAGLENDPEESLKRVDWILGKAGEFGEKTVHEFVEYMKTQFQIDLPVGGVGDSVQLMSIHQAKGLEFPVVFLAGLGKKFNLQDLNTSNILFDRKLGFGCKVVHEELPVRYPAASFKSVKENMHRNQLEEELRKLYVGMTRARERLYLVGTVRQSGFAKLAARRKRNEDAPISNRERAGAFTDWLVPCILDCQEFAEKITSAGIELPVAEGSAFEAEFYGEIASASGIDAWYASQAGSRLGGESRDIGKSGSEPMKKVASSNLADIVPEIVLFDYPAKALTAIPSKISASALSALDDPEGLSASPDFFSRDFVLPTSPRSNTKQNDYSSGAEDNLLANFSRNYALERGIATHKLMQNFAFELMGSDRLITAERLSAVDTKVFFLVASK